jgi:phosphatidate cytidylyltransferase
MQSRQTAGSKQQTGGTKAKGNAVRSKTDERAVSQPRSSQVSRIVTAVIALPILIASILVSWLEPLFILIAAAAMLFGLYEFYMLARKKELKPDVATGFLGSAALFTVFCFASDPTQTGLDVQTLFLALLVLTIATLIAATLRGAPFDKMIGSAGATILGVVYVVLLGGHLVALRVGFQQQLAGHLLSFFFLVLMGADTGAYYTGRAIGTHKLAPTISPGKTWEGVAGGLVAGLALAAVAHFWFFRELPLKWTLPLATVMVALGILGDLTESALKRSAGAKDAAKILPGHGGVLDRLDSLLFNAPLIYYFAYFYFSVRVP